MTRRRQRVLKLKVFEGKGGKYWFTGTVRGRKIIQSIAPGSVSRDRAEELAMELRNCEVQVEHSYDE